MNTLIGILAIVLIFIIVFQLAKASELMGILKGDKEGQTSESTNNTHGFLLMFLMITGLIAVILGWWLVEPKLIQGSLSYEPASMHGKSVNNMFWTTSIICGIAFFITQALLFFFSYKYRARKGHKAQHFSHDNKLEIIWTVIPAIVLTVLVARGIETWYEITSDAPEGARIVEVTAQQFNWIVRYPGDDAVLGKREFELISGENALGINWSDEKSHDDIMPTEIVLEKDVPVMFKLGAKDVLHSFYLAHFIIKMDCVPGIPTQFWMKPTISTNEMREIQNNSEFDFELACAELCGRAHYNMRFVVKVLETKEYNEWLAEQTPFYETVKASLNPATETAPAVEETTPATDSTTVTPVEDHGHGAVESETNVISSL